eukprot:5887007-Pyramimonas_sp.AAC.3
MQPEFNQFFDFQNLTMPGASTLKISVWDYNQYKKDLLIGTTSLDLEDRWYSDKFQEDIRNEPRKRASALKHPKRPKSIKSRHRNPPFQRCPKREAAQGMRFRALNVFRWLAHREVVETMEAVNVPNPDPRTVSLMSAATEESEDSGGPYGHQVSARASAFVHNQDHGVAGMLKTALHILCQPCRGNATVWPRPQLNSD